MKKDSIKVGLAQIAPIWLNRAATIDKIVEFIDQAGAQNCDLTVFGEAILPGYPFWLEKTNGAVFNSPKQKEIHGHYLDQAVNIESGHLERICARAAQAKTSVYLGIIERPYDRGGHSLYCSMIYISKHGQIESVHRKLVPTYEERLCWSPGDGHGLVTHPLDPFTVGGLNCWENWMPLTRAALYAQGEDLHVSIWPGNKRNTEQLIPVLAQEARSYVIGVCGLFRTEDIPDDFSYAEEMRANSTTTLANGGSCLAAPDGSWIIAPFTDDEKLVTAEISHKIVREERQNFDPAGHYSRPDVLQLHLNRDRQSILK